MDLDARLRQLQEQLQTQKSLEAKRAALETQCEQLRAQVQQLEKQMRSEQADVERLNRASLTAMLAALLGNKEERLDKEKAEAYAARVKYDAASMQLQQAEADLQYMLAQLRELTGSAQEYDKVLAQKAQAIQTSGSAAARQLFTMDHELLRLQGEQKELTEAIAAGAQAKETVARILSSLDSAEGWGVLDVAGGGIWSDIAKHGHLDDAQAEVETLQKQLQRFQTELADVTIHADLKISVDGFMRFADYFFDNFFTDWTVLDQIQEARSRVEQTQQEVDALLSYLRNQSSSTQQQMSALQAQRDDLIATTSL